MTGRVCAWKTADICGKHLASSDMVLYRPLRMQVRSVSCSSAERPAPVSHDTGWWFPLPWRHFLLPASGLVGNMSQGYSPPSLSLPPLAPVSS